MSIQSILYEIQGLRVGPMSEVDIKKQALPIAKFLGFTVETRRRLAFDEAIERLSAVINLEILSADEWQELTHNLTKGHFSPSELTIRIPEAIYKAACKGEKNGLEVVLHELGHAILGHHVTLHKADAPATKFENAEWQADIFAAIILEVMGIYSPPVQLSLDLGE